MELGLGLFEGDEEGAIGINKVEKVIEEVVGLEGGVVVVENSRRRKLRDGGKD